MRDQFANRLVGLLASAVFHAQSLVGRDEFAGSVYKRAIKIKNKGVKVSGGHAGLQALIM